jgi:methylthioribulose-1-phosphate dehydratase
MINLSSTWSRIGSETTEFGRGDHSNSNSGSSLLCTSDPNEEGRVVRALVAQLCEKFYDQGWATGTGGGVSIRIGGGSTTTENNNDDNRPYRVFVAPSGVMKEDIIGDDIFELDMNMNIVHKPISNPNLRLSACTPLWYMVYKHRPKVMCVIHTHSMHAQLATLLDVSECSSVLKVTHLEMLKGVGNHAYDDILEIPIIDNRPTEDQLADQLELVLVKYPKCNAVLVRRHGVYVWGDSWEQAKAQCESFDYLFESAVKMKGLGLDCGIVPLSGTYHVNKTTGEEDKEEEMPPTKKLKIAPAFNASSATNNDVDMMWMGTGMTSIPLVPRDAKILLLDIEGTTTSISFVKDTLFPYVLNNMDRYIDTMNDHGQLYCALRDDINMLDDNHPAKVECTDTPILVQADIKNIELMISILMKYDVKATVSVKMHAYLTHEQQKRNKLYPNEEKNIS